MGVTTVGTEKMIEKGSYWNQKEIPTIKHRPFRNCHVKVHMYANSAKFGMKFFHHLLNKQQK